MTMTIDKEQVSRRGVLAGLGGMSFCFAIGASGERLISQAEANTPADAKPFNAWVRIAPNGAITIYSAGAEMGQGSMTSLPLIVAEEMDADWSKVSIEMAPADSSSSATGTSSAVAYTRTSGSTWMLLTCGPRSSRRAS